MTFRRGCCRHSILGHHHRIRPFRTRSPPMSKLAWGIIGTGAIAKTFAKDLAQAKRGALVAVGSRSQAKADAFVAELKLASVTAHGSYEALLADPAVQAVNISTPHPQHAEWAIKAAEAGKHLLVEKPLGITPPQRPPPTAAAP